MYCIIYSSTRIYVIWRLYNENLIYCNIGQISADNIRSHLRADMERYRQESIGTGKGEGSEGWGQGMVETGDGRDNDGGSER